MPEIRRFFGSIIAIESLTVLEGKRSRPVLGLVLEWAAAHQGALLENWNLALAQVPLKPIEPSR